MVIPYNEPMRRSGSQPDISQSRPPFEHHFPPFPPFGPPPPQFRGRQMPPPPHMFMNPHAFHPGMHRPPFFGNIFLNLALILLFF